jgi:PadR family transcriptional regulator PadR
VRALDAHERRPLRLRYFGIPFKHIEIADGTVYPLLRKLKSEGYVTTYLCEESGGPPRKYYSITESGRALYRNERKEWLSFIRRVEDFLDLEENDE